MRWGTRSEHAPRREVRRTTADDEDGPDEDGLVVRGMPELPDVEGFRRVLVDCARAGPVERVDVHDTGVLHGADPKRLREALRGRRFTQPERHGKWLLAPTDGPQSLLFHFGMTGGLLCRPEDERTHPHDRVVFSLGGGRQLRYRDQRKLKGIWLADQEGVARTLDGQGPDAADVSRSAFVSALSGRRGGIKSALTNQSVLAGIGNLLADEILWRARLHPQRGVAELDEDELGQLHTAMTRTLRSAMPEGCVPPRDSWLTGHRDEPDGACPRCGTRLEHGRVAGRGGVWCPHCQPLKPST